MSTAAAAGDPSAKLRMVLDYVPCEACLAHRVSDQELLCSICRRVDRQVGIRVAVKTSILVERPSPPEPASPVVIEPTPVAPPPATSAPMPVEVHFVEPGRKARKEKAATTGAIEVFVEPFEEPAPALAAAAAVVADEEPSWDDVADFSPPAEDLFEAVPGGPVRRAPAAAVVDVPQDDFVFRPPPAAEEPPAPREEEPTEDWLPVDEVPVTDETPARRVPAPDEPSPWSRPPAETVPEVVGDEVVEEEPVTAAEVVEDEVVAAEPFEAEPIEAEPVEDDVIESTVVEDEPEPVEAEVLGDVDAMASGTPAAWSPEVGSDLWRLRGFDKEAEGLLGKVSIRQLAHLAGHDATELADRTGLPLDRVAPWVSVADLVQDVGVPVEAALSLVQAGIDGPKGLRDAAPEDVVDRVKAFGVGEVTLAEVKRWKRRA